jgi:hypothetical protein
MPKIGSDVGKTLSLQTLFNRGLPTSLAPLYPAARLNTVQLVL